FTLDSRSASSGAEDARVHAPLFDELAWRLEGLADAAQRIPRQLGNFRIEGTLGQGGMGLVLKARHVVTGAEAAVKIAAHARPALVDALRLEARALGKVNSPHVVKVIDFGQTEELAWMALEYVPGQTLAQWIRERHSPAIEFYEFDDETPLTRSEKATVAPPLRSDEVRRVLDWLRSLAMGLGAMHEAGLIHRDIKPANILIDREGVPRLIDFGLSAVEGDPIPGVLSGTLPYMSPEQTLAPWLGLQTSSDVYSLVVTFHEALTGRRVVQNRGLAAVRQVAFDPVPTLRSQAGALPADLEPLFEQALRKNPERRTPHTRALIDDIDAWFRARRARPFKRIAAAVVLLVFLGAVRAVAWPPISDYLEVRRHRLARFAAIDAAVAERRGERALQLVLDATKAERDHEDFVDKRRAAVALAAPARTALLLRHQAVAVELDSVESRRERYAKDAKALLEVVDDPDLAFQAIFAALLENRLQEARVLFERHRGIGSLVAALEPVLLTAEKQPEPMRAALAAIRNPDLHPEIQACLEYLCWGW
ncbi:MAG: serine/threonine protein kinase, partial [Planctomycetes bacterium]|nr:serine/threonine protein kinase [Planctomycetota bacterium]